LYLCPSPVFGYGLPLLLERIEAREPDSAVLCVEAARELLALPFHKDWNSGPMPLVLADSRVLMLGIAGASPVREESPAEGAERVYAAALQRWGLRRFRRVEVLHLSGGWQLYPELYAFLAEALRSGIAADWGNAMTLVKLGRRYARNFIRNLALIPRRPSLSALSYGWDPVLVLGAGPSLDSFLRGPAGPILRGGKRNFRIVCVDTVIPSLMDRGIRPDLVAALESQHWNLRDFTGARGWGVPLAMDLSALPATAEVLGGPCYLFFTPWTELNLFKRLKAAALLPAAFPPLGSVGISTAAAALSLTRGPVILCGIDFSFTLDSYHARSTPAHREKLRRQTRFRGILNQEAAFRVSAFEGLSKSGRPVRSDPAMRNYRDLFEREFAAEPRLRDIEGPGLPLGIPSLSCGEAAAILGAGGKTGKDPAPAGLPAARPEETEGGRTLTRRLGEFAVNERNALERLRQTLRGERAMEPEKFEELLDSCDYLWAHFPDCAGRRRPAADISFLKRVRTEIEPFMGLWEFTLRSCAD
jgi:hypothetical protein